jgi:hypothetical protein
VGVGVKGTGAPCHVCGQRSSNGGKVKRWAENLSDTQIVDLIGRLNRTLSQSASIDPVKLRETLVTFVSL